MAFAYVGNKIGLDVLDFRGGDSCSFFATYGTIKEIAKLDNVKSHIEEGYNDFLIAGQLVRKMKENKEYYFCVAEHAAIVKKVNGGFQFLDLQQDSKDNGFKSLNNKVLKERFKCQKSRSFKGVKIKTSGLIIDCDSLNKSKDFKEMLNYINTKK